MLMPISDHTQCPSCGSSVPLSNAARIQAKQLGVSCVCHLCNCEWMYIEDSQPNTTAEALGQTASVQPAPVSETNLIEDSSAPRTELHSEPRSELNTGYSAPTTYITQ